MAIRTKIVGPYDHLPTSEKVRIQVGIPKDIVDAFFTSLLPRHGAQDKILSCAFFSFHSIILTHYPDFASRSLDERETIAIHVLNHIHFSNLSYDPTINYEEYDPANATEPESAANRLL